jgi:diadenosine tetraphosphatase ApaH/serine/threonine PP2A family protein phosphatase
MNPDGASRYGIVADVHSNLQALEAVIAFLDREGAQTIWCLGDVVGYGGDPSACVSVVRERCAGTVRGNHDVAAVDPRLRAWFNPHARAAIERQAQLLSEEDLAWLGSLPATLEAPGAAITHSGFADPDAFDYVTTARHATVELGAIQGRIGFYGHTHVPALWRRASDGGVERVPLEENGTISLSGSDRWLVNPGAVGQPRDGDPRAACAIFDPEAWTLRYVRLPYDLAAAQDAIARAGMPPFEAARLAHGM